MNGRFTTADRDRRWDATRRLITECGLDFIVTAPSGGQRQPDSTYLLGTPARGMVCCLMRPNGAPIAVGELAEVAATWVEGVEAEAARLGQAVAEQIRASAPSPKRIGVTGLCGLPGATDGTMPAQVMAQLEEALTDASWVDVSLEMRAIREIKSTEEIAVLAAAAELAERAVDRAAEMARPGSTDLAAWAAMVGELVRGGAEPPTTSRWGSGLRPLVLDRPPHAELQRASILILEPEASLDGYRAHVIRPLAIDSCDAIFRDLCAVQAEYWQACFELIEPGRPIAELFGESAAILKRLTARPGRYQKIQGSLGLVGCGLGLDAPLIQARPSDGADDRNGAVPCMSPGWVFELHAPISFDIGPRVLTASWTDVVAIEGNGARRLGRKPPGLLLVGDSPNIAS